MKQLIKILTLLVLPNVYAAGYAGGATVRLSLSQVIRMAQEP